MSLLAKGKSGATIGSQVYVIYGPEGTGKSTFASKFPSPYFLDIEDGTRSLDVTRLTSEDIPDLATLEKTLNEFMTTEHSYKTVVIDSLTILEQYFSKSICGDKYKSIGDLGFGEGYIQLADHAARFMNLVRKLQRQKDMNVIIIAHTKVKGFTDAYDNSSYDRYILQCHERIAEKVKSAADNVFFVKHDVSTVKDEKTKKTKAFSSGDRIMYTEWRAGADAKNRLNLPYELPLNYESLIAAIETSKPKSASELVSDIRELIKKSGPENVSIASKKLEEAGDDTHQLIRLKNKLTEMVRV